MKQPSIEFTPIRPAVGRDRDTTLDLVVRLLPPELQASLERPRLNLGLVIDRSGSMAGDKIAFARQAAQFAVTQLLPTDRVSVTLFDDRVEVLVPSTAATDRASILRAIEGIRERGSTALHAGWLEGATQVAAHLSPTGGQLDRVILLSDGQANAGETNPDVIGQHVHGLAQRGVSTTTLGVGLDYNEDLLEAMARSGDGNYAFIETPDQLSAIFAAELQGLMATTGRAVSLGLEPTGGVIVVDLFNDLEKNRTGRYRLANLVVGNPLEVVVRLKVPALTPNADLLGVRLAWDDPETGERRRVRAMLRLPALPDGELDALPFSSEVREKVALLEAARAKKEAADRMDRGDIVGARASLQAARGRVAALAPSPAIMSETAALEALDLDLDSGSTSLARKKAMAQRYDRQSSKPTRSK